MSNINIDGKEYPVAMLTDEARAQISSLQVCDRKLAELQAEIAIIQTARVAYSNALKGMLPADNIEV